MAIGESLGYKPQVICGLLDIGDQTLRYWRSSIIPNGHRAFFTGRDVFALKILSILIYECRFDVSELELFPLQDLFSYCQTSTFTELRESILLLNRNDYSITLTTTEDNINRRDRAIVDLYLEDIVNEFVTDLFDYGLR